MNSGSSSIIVLEIAGYQLSLKYMEQYSIVNVVFKCHMSMCLRRRSKKASKCLSASGTRFRDRQPSCGIQH